MHCKSLQRKKTTITATEVLGYLLYHLNYMKNKETAGLGDQLFNGTFKSNNYDVNDAIAIMHLLVLSKEQMSLMRNIMESKGIHFPNTTQFHPVLEGKRSIIDYRKVVEDTVKSTIFSDEIKRY